QLAAVTHEGNPLLILAGAGSGKTRVITTKIAYLINQKNVNPYSILSVTFTKKAADEMRTRAVAMDERAAYSQIRTFHSFGSWFLRKYAEEAGVVPSFTVYDDDDMAILVKKAVPALSKKEAQAAAREISLAKDYCLLPGDDLTFIGSQFDLNDIYTRYENRLRSTGNVDFGDLIMLPVRVMQSNPVAAQAIHDRFKVIMVDEYQDSNIAQYKLLQTVSGAAEGNDSYVCVVGDDDQSIYHFRGAEVQNILSFPEKFKGTDIIRLEKNYRSTTHILKAASLVVSNNQDRLGKNLIATRGDGGMPVLAFVGDQNEEASFCSSLIEKAVEAGGKYSDWAILYRTNAQSLGFEKDFLHKRIPYVVVGSLKFYEREEIKDTLAYLALCANSKDEIAFRRIVNKPVRGIGDKTQDKIHEYAVQNNLTMIESLEKLLPELSKKAREGADAFLKLYEKFTAFFGAEEQSDGKKLSDFIKLVVMDSGLYDYHKAGDEIEGTQRTYNLQELENSALSYSCSLEGLIAFLDAINLDRSLELQNEEKANDAVTLITLHNTKGLEYNRVIITGLEEGVFPRGDKAGADLEEERRLFYVGITRARNELYVTSAAQRVMYGALQFMRPSPFLNEAASAFKIIGNKPYGFGSHGGSGFGGGGSRFGASGFGGGGSRFSGYGAYGAGYGAYGSFGSSSSEGKWGSKSEIAEKWKKGVKVFHDDYGYGVISSCELANEEYKITVTFENSGKKAFLPEYQSHSLLIVKD
ncbi:MAG: UvrD-helicase domain-containing protein, partial [Treponema sp.]|nr:UvrD-helicase domain-containing protein [Treponema sp.]